MKYNYRKHAKDKNRELGVKIVVLKGHEPISEFKKYI